MMSKISQKRITTDFAIEEEKKKLTCINKFILNTIDGFIYGETQKSNTILKIKKNYILIILKGKCEIGSDTLKTKVLHENEMIALSKGCELKIQILEDIQYILFCCDQILITNALLHIQPGVSRSNLTKSKFETLAIHVALRKYLDLLVVYLQNGMNNLDLQEIKEKEFLYVLKSFYTSEETNNFLYPLISNSSGVVEYIDEYFLKYKTIEELIKNSPFSKSVFIKKFNEEGHGLTIHQYINEKKKKIFLDILKTPDASISDIAFQLKWDRATLYRNCMKEFNLSPAQLISREKRCGQKDETGFF